MSSGIAGLISCWYALSCAVVGWVAESRGHSYYKVFFICVIATPFIGAILYSTPKK